MRVAVMAIVNATPDSFSDGGRLPSGAALESHLAELVAQGAAMLDIGGESTRPGHRPVAASEEKDRILPVIRAARAACDVPVSIDTQKASVAQAALAAGASIVNDVSGLADPDMPRVMADASDVVLMRRADLGPDVVQSCRTQLESILQKARGAGLERIILDPGLGFGDPPGGDPEANLALIRGIPHYAHDRVLIGASRKRFIGTLTGVTDPARRVHGSVGLAVLAAVHGASIVRVHDVAATVQALRAAGF